MARKHHVDCILAIGGGSVIDEAKVIAFGALSEQDVWDFFTLQVEKPEKALPIFPEKALPIFAIPTLAATGSEMNSGAVITDDENSGQKRGMTARCMAPQISILDPGLTLTVTKEYTVYGLVDTFSHVLDGYFNGDEDVDLPVQDGMCEGLFRSIIKISKQLLGNLENYNFRADAMWAACVANNRLLRVGRGRIAPETHCLAHSLGALFDIPHGAAISISIPAWMTFRQSQKKDRLVQFSKRVFELDGESGDTKVTSKGIEAIKEWLTSLNAPTSLLEFDVDKDKIPAIIENIEPTAFNGGMRNVDRQQLEKVIRLMF